jgi:hypothetical protein
VTDELGDPTETEIDYELGELKAQQQRLTGLITRRMRDLDELWAKAKAADRLLAVQRLVQSGALGKELAGELDAKNERVRDLLQKARTERKRLEKKPDDHKLRHQVFLLELACQRGEQERDELVDKHDLRGPLYFCAETFVRSEPFGPDEAPLKDLAARVRAVEERIAMLEKQVRRGARFTKLDADGRERTLIRLLPALTMTGEGEPI